MFYATGFRVFNRFVQVTLTYLGLRMDANKGGSKNNKE